MIMKRDLLWLFLLLQGLAFCHAAAAQTKQKVLTTDSGKDHKGDGFRAEVAASHHGGQSVQPGADLVDSALGELRKLYIPLHHRIRRSNGILGTALNLALKALPRLSLTAPPTPETTSKPTLSGPLLHATGLLEEAARKNNSDALYLLAELNYYGNYSHPRHMKTAFDYYQKLATLNGNSSAMYMIGLMHSTGVGDAVERDQARALLYYTFAADQGHTRAEMTVAHRHHAGIGVPKNCHAAVKYYKPVADKAIAWYRSGPPGGMSWIAQAYKISDELGGVYGEGASFSSAGHNALKAHPNSDAYASIEDIIEYLDLMSQKGDFKASFNLGRIYYDGQRMLPRNLELARHYFHKVTKLFWKNGRIVDNYKPGLDKTACKAAGYLGRMYLRGEGVEQNFERALFWFERGMTHSDPQSAYGQALMLLNGYGVAKNVGAAIERLKVAADSRDADYAPAQVQLGALYLDQGNDEDLVAASSYFEMAARYGNMEAFYYLAEMQYHGLGREKSCSTAASFYKTVAEKAEPLVSSWTEANLAYEANDKELAFLEYVGMAEQGYEKAQSNVAFLVDPEQSKMPWPEWLYRSAKKPALLQNSALGLIYWTRSAKQGNIDALVKMGDYYLDGIGTNVDIDKAVQCYTSASEYHQSAQALYNLGWMHEHGVGLNQDYHLAKRFYDSALETNEEAYLPVALSLLKLRAKSAWNTLTNGRINSIQDEPVPKKDWSLSEWIANFLQDDRVYYDDGLYDDELYDDGMPGGDSGISEMDDGIFESLLIVGLAAALVFLVLYRQQRQVAARRREEREEGHQPQNQNQNQNQGQGQGQAPQQQQPPQGGFFPQPGDPDFGQWAAGGVGH
ncbi:protein sel-1 1 [Rhypophila decipiens]